MNKQICLIILLFAFRICDGQIDLQCSGRDMHSIYLNNASGEIYRIDSVDTNPTNPILVTTTPSNTGGISINANLDSLTGPETMYFVSPSNAYYYFWNGTNWSNTNHTSGNASALNPGGTSSYIFNLYGNSNMLYRYDGTGNGTLLLSNLQTFSAALYDVATDNQGNFYLCYSDSQKIIAYNSTGIKIDSFSTTGLNGSGGGFAILGNRIYAIGDASDNLYEGIKTGSNINFTLIKTLPFMVYDIATCPEAGIPLSVVNNSSLPHLIVYPNPFFDKLNVLLNDNNNNSEIILYDIASRKLLKQQFTNSVTLNTEQLAKGIYLYEVRNKNGVIKKGKVVKD